MKPLLAKKRAATARGNSGTPPVLGRGFFDVVSEITSSLEAVSPAFVSVVVAPLSSRLEVPLVSSAFAPSFKARHPSPPTPVELIIGKVWLGPLLNSSFYGYRYDALVGVVSYALGERLSQRLPSVRDYGSVLLQRDVRVVSVPDAERHATIAHGNGQLSALPRKLAVFGLYDDLVYPGDRGAVGKYVDNVSGNEDIFAEGGTPLQGTFLLILRLGLRRRRVVR